MSGGDRRMRWPAVIIVIALVVLCDALWFHSGPLRVACDVALSSDPPFSLLYVDWFVHDEEGRAVASVAIAVDVKEWPILLDAADTTASAVSASPTPLLRWLQRTDEDGRATLHSRLRRPHNTPLLLSSALITCLPADTAATSALRLEPQQSIAHQRHFARTGQRRPHRNTPPLHPSAFPSPPPPSLFPPSHCLVCCRLQTVLLEWPFSCSIRAYEPWLAAASSPSPPVPHLQRIGPAPPTCRSSSAAPSSLCRL